MLNRFNAKLTAKFEVVQHDRTEGAKIGIQVFCQGIQAPVSLEKATSVTTDKELRYQVRVADIMKRLQLGV